MGPVTEVSIGGAGAIIDLSIDGVDESVGAKMVLNTH